MEGRFHEEGRERFWQDPESQKTSQVCGILSTLFSSNVHKHPHCPCSTHDQLV